MSTKKKGKLEKVATATATISEEKIIKQQPLRTYISSDGTKFEIDYALFSKYSAVIRDLNSDEETVFKNIDTEVMEYICKFLDIHKEVEPRKIEAPLKTNKQIGLLMDKPDVDLVTEIKKLGYQKLERVLDATLFLQMNDFKSYLLTAITLDLISKDVEQLREEFQLDKIDIDEQKLKEQFRAKLPLPPEF